MVTTSSVHEVQRLQIEDAAAHDAKHVGVLLAVERRALPAAPDRDADVAVAGDRFVKAVAGAWHEVDSCVATRCGSVDLFLNVFRQEGQDLAGEEWQQRRRRWRWW